ncbi:CueP family metal-binding protein [Solibacillus daqui]|uniref:CueP family metal-binding protein n=1 Tax=Solibacillus daqui TaxID=2912187 RepID=UPI0023658904|nr:CueP family metal-binding protein [Solibacillus daqui]
MKLKLVAVSLLAVAVLAACGDEQQTESKANTEQPQQGERQAKTTVTQGQTDDIKGLIENYSSNKTTNEKASITSQQLIVTDKDGNETHYALPTDEFFVSIAPYFTNTHPCKDHSLTGCQGELVAKDIDVFIENENGEVIFDDTVTTLENGFIDLWLPRNEAFVIEMVHDGKKVSGEITTFDEDGTCVTTLQMI